jgi:hypothetical protein
VARGGYHPPGPGKRSGRPPLPKIELKTNTGIASTVLSMDGPPDHTRKCKCDVCAGEQKKTCECKVLESDTPGSTLKITCRFCNTREDHKICRCEICGWWDPLASSDRRLRFEARKYLTDRRDGKPAQGVFVGDTRETARDLDFGDLPELVAAGESKPARKPN